MTRLRFFLSLVGILAVVFSAQPVSADIGPKPTMEFEFKQDLPDGGVLIVSGILYECGQTDCGDAVPLEEVGPQRFWCVEFRCSALGYGFAPYHQIEIQFSDGKTRQSNIFETIDFQSYYIVTVNPDDLLVEQSSGSPAPPFDEPLPEATFEPFAEGRNSIPTILLGVGALGCVGLVSLLAIGLAIFLVRRFGKK